MNKSKIILLSTLAVLSLTACSSKSETESLPEPTATPVVTMPPQVTSTPQPTSIPDNHDFDNAINTFKDEYAMEHGIDIEINPDDNGTDIEDLTTLHDWLYSNGVTRESVQNDRDSGCKNPYLDGYLEYLDNLDKPSEESENPDDVQYADDGSAVIDYTDEELAAIEAAGGLSADEWNEQVEDISDEVHKAVESGEARKEIDDMFANHPEWSDMKKG